MAQINKPNQYFNTKLYTGNGTDNSATQSINMGLQPDLTWIKNRNLSGASAQAHHLFDSVRGGNLRLQTDFTSAESDKSDRFNGITSTGFDLVQDDAGTNRSPETYVAWGWKAGGTASSNTDGSITSTVSANITSGFSIVSYTGTGSSGATIGHGLGVAPKMIIAKNRSIASNWLVYNYSMSANGDYALFLDSTSAKDNSQDYWGDTEPTSSVFTVGSRQEANGSGNNIIAYCFAEKKGFSKFGSYTGNGSADGTFVYTGFKPSFIMIKGTSLASDWNIWDNKRPDYNVVNRSLEPHQSDAETVSAGRDIDILSNGFKARGTSSSMNSSGGSYIYMAFAESPLVGTNNIPATAR